MVPFIFAFVFASIFVRAEQPTFETGKPEFSEEQGHGLSFEQWILDKIFNAYEGHYTQKWDVPALNSSDSTLPEDLRGLPVSIKMVKYGSPIGLGDAVRQRRIARPFIMIVGFWNQRTPTQKWVEAIGVAKFTPPEWDDLWGSLSIETLQEFNAQVKDRSVDYRKVRKAAQAWKDNVFDHSGSVIVVNPKIGSSGQRRVQCSLPFDMFWEQSGAQPERTDFPELFGMRFPNPIESEPRSLDSEP